MSIEQPFLCPCSLCAGESPSPLRAIQSANLTPRQEPDMPVRRIPRLAAALPAAMRAS
jgi:hypothetical protein